MVNAEDDKYGRVLKMISGIVFLGVPHQSASDVELGHKCAELTAQTTGPG